MWSSSRDNCCPVIATTTGRLDAIGGGLCFHSMKKPAQTKTKEEGEEAAHDEGKEEKVKKKTLKETA